MSTDKQAITLEEIRERLVEKIRKAEYQEFFGLLRKHLNPEKSRDHIQLESQFNQYKRNVKERRVPREALEVTLNHIVGELTSIAATNEYKDWIKEPAPSEQRKPRPKHLSPKWKEEETYHKRTKLVAWDRDEIVGKFFTAYDNKTANGANFQHYFMICPKEHYPYCIIERIYYEVFDQKLEASDKIYISTSDGLVNRTVRPKIFPQKIGKRIDGEINLKRTLCVELLKKSIKDYDGALGTKATLGQLLGEAFHTSSYSHSIIIFELKASKWEPHTTALLRWFIEEFCEKSEELSNCTFIFFYVIKYNVPGSRPGPASDILDKLEQEVVGQNKDKATILPEPKKATLEDIQAWIEINIDTDLAVVDNISQVIRRECKEYLPEGKKERWEDLAEHEFEIPSKQVMRVVKELLTIKFTEANKEQYIEKYNLSELI